MLEKNIEYFCDDIDKIFGEILLNAKNFFIPNIFVVIVNTFNLLLGNVLNLYSMNIVSNILAGSIFIASLPATIVYGKQYLKTFNRDIKGVVEAIKSSTIDRKMKNNYNKKNYKGVHKSLKDRIIDNNNCPRFIFSLIKRSTVDSLVGALSSLTLLYTVFAMYLLLQQNFNVAISSNVGKIMVTGIIGLPVAPLALSTLTAGALPIYHGGKSIITSLKEITKEKDNTKEKPKNEEPTITQNKKIEKSNEAEKEITQEENKTRELSAVATKVNIKKIEKSKKEELLKLKEELLTNYFEEEPQKNKER